MITITKKEEIVFNQIKIFHLEYADGIPENIIKMELGIYEHELKEILTELTKKNLIKYEEKRIQLISFENKINSVNSREEVIKADLNEKEQETLEIIKNLVNPKNLISKYILEGNLLYGDLKLSNFSMYRIMLSLENKDLIKSVQKSDGEYYKLIKQ